MANALTQNVGVTLTESALLQRAKASTRGEFAATSLGRIEKAARKRLAAKGLFENVMDAFFRLTDCGRTFPAASGQVYSAISKAGVTVP